VAETATETGRKRLETEKRPKESNLIQILLIETEAEGEKEERRIEAEGEKEERGIEAEEGKGDSVALGAGKGGSTACTQVHPRIAGAPKRWRVRTGDRRTGVGVGAISPQAISPPKAISPPPSDICAFITSAAAFIAFTVLQCFHYACSST
jgi:hypothetical protein